MERIASVIRTVILFAGLCTAAGGALAQAKYPTKPMRWVIPYTPGGGADLIARPIAQRLGEVLGQPIVYDNRGGAGGLIAAEYVARSAPDGYTFLVPATNTHTIGPALTEKLSYDPVKDFAPITQFDTTPNILVANAAFPPKTIKELVAYGKANPNKIAWGSSGNGSAGHLALLEFAERAGIKVVHVPYKGAAPAMTGTLSGENQLLFLNAGVVMPHLKSGKLRAIGFGSPKRLSTLPDVPTFEESGYPGFESSNFKGLLAPAGTPRALIDKLHAELVKIVHAPDNVARMSAAGSIPVGNTPEQFGAYIKQEIARYGKLVKAYGIKAD
jgi:tripartite-type tricarboxylate transporter receptor subunit TctC